MCIKLIFICFQYFDNQIPLSLGLLGSQVSFTFSLLKEMCFFFCVFF